MRIENYNKIMRHLDTIEIELNKVAAEVGHVSFEEFLGREISEKEYLQQAA